MEEKKIIAYLTRVEEGKSVREVVAENREWLLGEEMLNGWSWTVDTPSGDVVLTRVCFR